MINVNKYIINSSTQIRDSIVNKSDKFIDKLNIITNVCDSLHRIFVGDPIDQFIPEIKHYDEPHIQGRFIGLGSEGIAIRFNEFVVKYPINGRSYSERWSNCYRTSRVLNSINGPDYSRAYKLDSGDMVLVSKYVNGTNVSKKEALDFINSKGLSIHDAHREGNVIRDKENRLFLIDASTVVQTPLKRKNSLASDEFYKRFPDKLT
ncbi:hypothetical protein [Yersinia mollaretii]|uniref:Uncharacterized protein n=1 Tax=Yersinia mollaretii TaxID=33060 RepID=A0AA36PMG3_YERMO|nr:hypothetical protein [Yersinia mollaretii]MDA5527931.1 hypothetical protein [Yersinia mollaretii]MDR7874064.1 hypothetical protein [Yersinia mollaretii]PHZ31388.1 hypothetical protein CS537_12035 [Yersinia mollaretii]WQC74516.1 hypothetical protein U1Z61_19250 [Yersinia mollaretii]CNF11736.1 Uncharacterised protein [Yersinia mollaretii]